MSHIVKYFKRKPMQLISLLCVIAAVIWYFSYYSWAVGTPCAATIKCRDSHQVSLTEAQLEELTSILRDSWPTYFIHDPVGINNDNCLITLHYADGSKKEFSLWCMNSILYEGSGEDLTMDCMYGAFFHFGGWVDYSDMEVFLRQFSDAP